MANTRDEELLILANEVQLDPLGRGYNGPGSENPGPDPMTNAMVADSMNVRNRPTAGGPVPLAELYGDDGSGPLIDGGELTDLRTASAQDFQQVLLLSALWLEGGVAPDDNRYVEIAQVFPGGSSTRIAMNNRLQGLESRGEELTLPRPIKEGWVEEARKVDLGAQQQAQAEALLREPLRFKARRLRNAERLQHLLKGAA